MDKIQAGILEPGDSADSYSEVILSARRAENILTQLHRKMSKFILSFKRKVTHAKLEYRLAIRKLLVDPEFHQHASAKERQGYAEAALIEEFQTLQEAENSLAEVVNFLLCVTKLLQVVKHTREDIGRKIKLMELQKDLGEI